MISMRRIYNASLMLLFIGILVAGTGLGLRSDITFQVGAILVALAVLGVLAYAFRPKGRA